MSNLLYRDRKCFPPQFNRIFSSVDFLGSPFLCIGWQKIRSVLCLIMLSLVAGEPFQSFYFKNASLFCCSFSVSSPNPLSLYLLRSVFPPASESWLKTHGHRPAWSCLNTRSSLSVRPNSKTQPAFTKVLLLALCFQNAKVDMDSICLAFWQFVLHGMNL